MFDNIYKVYYIRDESDEKHIVYKNYVVPMQKE